MQDLSKKNIVLGVCGGVAAYKSVYLVRELTQLGAAVRVVMTESAQQFITPLMFQAMSGHEVRTSLFDASAEQAMGHIELARWADFLIIAPASANCLAKLANGLADDLLSTLYLATDAPLFICPAMNKKMWRHPMTQHNYERLVNAGALFVGPDEGEQACGDVGPGRLSDAQDIINALRLHPIAGCLRGEQLVITAGPTREAIDPVRYLSNHSSGKMGYALARAAKMAGAKVSLISGPTSLPIPAGIDCIAVNSAQEMHARVMECLQKDSIFIGAAAVADYSPLFTPQKIKKEKSSLTLDLYLNTDILSEVVASGKAKYVVGFAAETENLLLNAQKKLETKKVDMVIANTVGDHIGFGTDCNQVTLLTKTKQQKLSMNEKNCLAGEIMAIIATNLQNQRN